MEPATVANGRDRLSRWHPIIIVCHWLSVLLLAALFASGYLSGLGGFGLHANIGFLLLLVVILRVGTRIFTPSPRTGRSAVGRVVQKTLYLEMAALLLTGPSAVAWSAFVPPVRLFGEMPIPVLLSLGSSTAATLHAWLGYANAGYDRDPFERGLVAPLGGRSNPWPYAPLTAERLKRRGRWRRRSKHHQGLEVTLPAISNS